MTPIPFSRTLKVLDQDRGFVPLLALGLGCAVLSIWIPWWLLARLPAYVVSDEARLEVSGSPHQIDAPLAGRVARVLVLAGGEVGPGDLLFELERGLEQSRLEEEEARKAAAAGELASLRLAVAGEEAALASHETVADATTDEARARQAAANAAAKRAVEEAEVSARLAAEGLVSEQESRRRAAEAAERLQEAEALVGGQRRAGGEGDRERHDRRVRVAQLEAEIAQLEGAVAIHAAAAERARRELELRLVRSPVAGRLGAVAPLQPGAVVAAGDPLATVIPASELRIVALFPASALGRLRPGNPAELRLESFPWAQYGSTAAEVTLVESEARQGRVRVEASVRPAGNSSLPLAHGLPGTLAVEVERLSPLALLLRVAGHSLSAETTSAATEKP